MLGIVTIPDPQDFEDRADSINRFPCDLIHDQRYRDVIDTFVYPPVRGLFIGRYQNGAGECLGLILVPPQDPDDQPFVLKRIITEQGDTIETFVAPKRDGSHTRWTPIGIIHRDLADGKRFRSTEFTTVSPGEVESTVREEFAGWFQNQLQRIERFMDWSDATIYALAAAPVQRVDRIEGFSPRSPNFAKDDQRKSRLI